MAKQMCVCRVERVRGDGGGLGVEDGRQHSNGTVYTAANIDASRSHLNAHLVDSEGVGGNKLVSAIDKRIKEAGVTRKVAANQCKALVVYLSGTHDQMKEIEKQGRLPEWCDICKQWLKEEFGSENLVSLTLHRDEYTPHLHAVVVPITTEKRTRREREGDPKRKTKATVRLSADHYMTKANMRHWQDSFAEKMADFGLERGVVGSKARHQTMNEYYRKLKEEKIPTAEAEVQSLSTEIEQLESVKVKAKYAAENTAKGVLEAGKGIGAAGVAMATALFTGSSEMWKGLGKRLEYMALPNNGERRINDAEKQAREAIKEAAKAIREKKEALRAKEAAELRAAKSEQEKEKYIASYENDIQNVDSLKAKIAQLKIYNLQIQNLITDSEEIGLSAAQVNTLLSGKELHMKTIPIKSIDNELDEIKGQPYRLKFDGVLKVFWEQIWQRFREWLEDRKSEYAQWKRQQQQQQQPKQRKTGRGLR